MNQPTPQPTLKLGTSTYSYWHFLPEKTPIETVLDEAHKLGLHGIEILQHQLASEETVPRQIHGYQAAATCY